MQSTSPKTDPIATAETFAGVRVLTRAAVAALLGKSTKQVSNMQARQQIPQPITIPGVGVRWSAAAIEEYLQGVAAQIERAAAPVPRYVVTAPPVSLRVSRSRPTRSN